MNIISNQELCKLSDRIKVNLISFGYATVGTEWTGEVLSPVFSRLYYIASGKAAIIADGKKIMLNEGNWYLLPAEFSFEYECEKELEHYFMHLQLCDYDETDLLRECKTVLCIKAESKDIDILKTSIESKNALDGMNLCYTAFSILFDMLKKYDVNIRTENYSPCVKSAIRYIKKNLSVNLTVSEISEKSFVSKSTLTKHFKKELGMSVSQYVFDLIMTGAEHELSESDKSIQSISEKYGFYDQFYFSKRFKEKFGVPPVKYRKNKLR